ncbi:aluminum-activated malate transporter 10-like [Cornus florida]|uniref:aluminum-activated malate transporter 10-like n=1 Tax=Cornus florida TaxID=4283 RepID=UPI00289780D8|nr:aluminum-activated malate transporter 10-like [Cornus florida]
MANTKEAANGGGGGGGGGVEWRIRVGNGSSETLAPESSGIASKAWHGFQGLIVGLAMRVWRFIKKAWDLGVDEPRKVIHCLKVGMALTVVSLFYYMRPLYDGVGGNAMWAVMTVVVVFEYTVGATICKCLNRASGTFLAGALAVGVHWLASQSGEKIAPIIVGVSVFLLASAATFSRFIPVVKARFDYGAMIFILTFSLVTVSGYRVEKLIDLAHQRLSTIIVGISICIVIIMLIRPIWAGEELYLLIICNMDKLANSLDGCVAEYFSDSEGTTNSKEGCDKKLQGYKCVLNSKATEDSMAGFARWEPAHGRFNFQHPWKQYLKIGASMRNCAYCIEALNSCINSENQAPELIKKHLSGVCLRVGTNSSSVIKELAINIKSMRKSSTIDFAIDEMNSAVQELQNYLKSLPGILISPPPDSEAKTPENEKGESVLSTTTMIPLLEFIPVVTFASLLIEVVARIGGLVDEVEELGKLAEYKPAADEKPKQNQPNNKIVPNERDDDDKTMKTLQRV